MFRRHLSAIRLSFVTLVIGSLVFGSSASMIAARGSLENADASATPGIGTGPAADQFTWLLTTINESANDLTPEIIAEHFHADFLAAVPADQLIATLQKLAHDAAPLTIDEVIQRTDELIHVQLRTRDGAPFVIAMAIEPSHGRIAGLVLQPGTADRGTMASPAASPIASPEASPYAVASVSPPPTLDQVLPAFTTTSSTLRRNGREAMSLLLKGMRPDSLREGRRR